VGLRLRLRQVQAYVYLCLAALGAVSACLCHVMLCGSSAPGGAAAAVGLRLQLRQVRLHNVACVLACWM
jgi:hypothetical protein